MAADPASGEQSRMSRPEGALPEARDALIAFGDRGPHEPRGRTQPLERLSRSSGVSRAMLSKVERGPSPTATRGGGGMKTLDPGAGYVRYALGDLAVDRSSRRLCRHALQPIAPGGRSSFRIGSCRQQVDLVDGRLRLSGQRLAVVDRGEHILIDTGAADAWLPTMGSLLGALDEAGVARGACSTVAFMHTHEDHVNGLVAADGSDAFPNLRRLLVPQEEIPMFDAV